MYWASQVVPVVKKPPGESHGWRSLAGYTVHRVAQSWTWLKLLSMHACNVYTGCRDRLKSCDKSNLSQIIRSLWCENRGFFATGFIINSHCEIVKLHLYTDTPLTYLSKMHPPFLILIEFWYNLSHATMNREIYLGKNDLRVFKYSEHREGTGTPLQYSCLENPMARRAWRATVHGVAKSWTRLSDWA